MGLQARKAQLLATLEQVRLRVGQLQQALAATQAQEQQVLGALMLCDDLITEQEGVGGEAEFVDDGA